MIRSLRHKGLAELFEKGYTARIRDDLKQRCLVRLDVLDNASDLKEININGFQFHKLNMIPVRYCISVNGPWRLTFEWRDLDVWLVDLEQYH